MPSGMEIRAQIDAETALINGGGALALLSFFTGSSARRATRDLVVQFCSPCWY